jgi:hypothetical protein
MHLIAQSAVLLLASAPGKAFTRPKGTKARRCPIQYDENCEPLLTYHCRVMAQQDDAPTEHSGGVHSTEDLVLPGRPAPSAEACMYCQLLQDRCSTAVTMVGTVSHQAMCSPGSCNRRGNRLLSIFSHALNSSSNIMN